MKKRIRKKHFFIMLIVISISIILFGFFYILQPPPITVNLRRENGTSWVDIESVDEEVYRQLQFKGKSYYMTEDYLYTYGSTGFVYINLRNANVYIVLDEDMDQDYRAFITSYLTINRKKLKHYFPEIKFIKKEELDPEKYNIMMKLENEVIPYPHYAPIGIDNDIKK